MKKSGDGKSKARDMSEVLVQTAVDECRQIPSVGSMIRPLHASGFFRSSCTAGSGCFVLLNGCCRKLPPGIFCAFGLCTASRKTPEPGL